MNLLLFLLMNFFLPTHAAAPLSKNEFGCAKDLSLALYEFGSFYSEETKSGIDKDFVELLQKETGCHFNVSVRPRARIWSELNTGALMMSVSGLHSDEREQFVHFVDYVKTTDFVVISKRYKEARNFDYFLRGNSKLDVGVVRSFKHGKMIDEFVEKMRILGRVKEYANVKDLAEALAGDQIAMMFSVEAVFPGMLKEFKLTDKVLVRNWSDSSAQVGGLLLSKKHFSQSQAENWRNLVNKLRKDNEIRNIIKKHVEEKYVDSLVY